MKFKYCSVYALSLTNLTISSLAISFNQNPQINIFKFKLLAPILVLNGKKVAPGLGYNFPPLTLLPNTEELIGPDTSTLNAVRMRLELSRPLGPRNDNRYSPHLSHHIAS